MAFDKDFFKFYLVLNHFHIWLLVVGPAAFYHLVHFPVYLQVSPVISRRLGSMNLIRDIHGTGTNEF